MTCATTYITYSDVNLITGFSWSVKNQSMFVMAWGSTPCKDTTGSQLGTIDLATGVVTLFPTVFSHCFIDLAVNPDTGDIYAVDLLTDALYQVNAAGRAVHLIDFPLDLNYAQGMNYNPCDGNLYLALYYYQWDNYGGYFTTQWRVVDWEKGKAVLLRGYLPEVDCISFDAGCCNCTWAKGSLSATAALTIVTFFCLLAIFA
eukprot:TRINITY_DN6644_c0_g1_i1.p3 TRINITY_DN6644_c0_g1~~TRINITY_DN6644_c0_g1_i1.p3  ORF type:complete len:202 (+),score=64.59 TRINITY_DN6644_c0_g1_i1:151-756(+)